MNTETPIQCGWTRGGEICTKIIPRTAFVNEMLKTGERRVLCDHHREIIRIATIKSRAEFDKLLVEKESIEKELELLKSNYTSLQSHYYKIMYEFEKIKHENEEMKKQIAKSIIEIGSQMLKDNEIKLRLESSNTELERKYHAEVSARMALEEYNSKLLTYIRENMKL